MEALAKLDLPPAPQVGSQGADQNFLALKRLLDANGFKMPLGLESVPLVHRLFTELVQTSKAAGQFKEQADKMSEELGSIQKQLFPLRRENSRLVRINDAIHQETMKVSICTSSACFCPSVTHHHCLFSRPRSEWPSANASGAPSSMRQKP
jgi:hypothetical protein